MAAEVPDYPVRIAVAVTGDVGLLICLLGDEEFSLQLAGATAGFDGPRLEAARQNPVLLADGVGEFLNVLVGNAMAILERKKITTELEPPHCDPELDSGYLFDLAVGCGTSRRQASGGTQPEAGKGVPDRGIYGYGER